MKLFYRLLPIFTCFLVISCISFSSETVAQQTETEAVSKNVTEEIVSDVKPDLFSVLPAPIYFLSGDEGNARLWRIEADGITLKSIKDCCIRNYAVSPSTGKIAYVTNETIMIISDPDGKETIEVDLGEVSYPQDLDTALAWSPDGSQLALGGENGLWIYMPKEERLFQLSGTAEYTTFIRPLAYDAWSPNGSKILIMAHKPNASVDEIGVVSTTNGEVRLASLLTGGRATWAPDSESFYISSNIFGKTGILPSLIVVTIDKMEPTALLKAEFTEEGYGRYLEGAQVGPDNFLYYFYGEGPINHETKTTELTMYRSNKDGITDRDALRNETYFGLREILWAEDMSLAVITSTGITPNSKTGVLFILPTNGDLPAFSTPFAGYGLQWGHIIE